MRILFFDTETTGLVPKGIHYSTDYKQFPYPVQVAWQLVEDDKILIKEDHIIRPEGWEVPMESTEIHMITHDFAKINGMDMLIVLSHFIFDCKLAEKIVAHNIYFDTSIVKASLLRLGASSEIGVKALDKEKRVDTMKKSTAFVGARYADGKPGKWPTLEELYYKLFKEKIANHHDASADVDNLKKCYFELVKLGVL